VGSITVLTLVPNAGDRLPRCLESVSWADDLFCVVDASVTDGSDEVARRYSDHVVRHEFVDYGTQNNWALPQIDTEWTLILDADEWVPEGLADRIREIINSPDSLNGYDVRRLSYFLGKQIKHCGWHRDYNLRLFRTARGRYLDKRIHSRIEVPGRVGRITEPMYHDTYRTFEEFLATCQRFTTWGAQDLYDAGRRAGILDLTVHPLARFFQMYVMRHGFLDGYHGIVLCGLSTFSVFLKYAKLWNLAREAEQGEPTQTSS